LHRINNKIANLADYNVGNILLSLQKVEDEDLIREIVENAFNIDCVGNPITTRLGLYFEDLNLLQEAENSKALHFGINDNFPELRDKIMRIFKI
jgi:hypothetical protein